MLVGTMRPPPVSEPSAGTNVGWLAANDNNPTRVENRVASSRCCCELRGWGAEAGARAAVSSLHATVY